MELVEVIGYLLVAFLFAYNAFNHVTKHKYLVGYTESLIKGAPKELAYLGGWPTGVYLGLTALALIFQISFAPWLAIGFLIVTQVLAHRDLKEPGNLKHLALIGALLVIAAT